jgi:hypothetical protein
MIRGLKHSQHSLGHLQCPRLGNYVCAISDVHIG